MTGGGGGGRAGGRVRARRGHHHTLLLSWANWLTNPKRNRFLGGNDSSNNTTFAQSTAELADSSGKSVRGKQWEVWPPTHPACNAALPPMITLSSQSERTLLEQRIKSCLHVFRAAVETGVSLNSPYYFFVVSINRLSSNILS